MSEILNLDDLGELAPDTKTVELPALSERLGKPVSVVIKRIAPMDMLKLYDVPMDEINALVGSDDVGQKAGELIQEQLKAYDNDDYKRMIDSGIKFAVVDPEPTDAFVKHAQADSLMLFTEILDFSNGGMVAEDAARFREDGKRGGD